MADVGTVSKERALALLGGAVVLVVLIAVLTQGGGGDGPGPVDPEFAEPAETSPTTAPDAAADATGSGEPARNTDIGFFDCRSLVSTETAAIALEQDDPEGRILSTFLFATGERCVHQDADVEANYVVIEPGLPADFAADTRRLDVAGTPVADIGAAAVWFPGDGVGSLTVAEESSLGTVFVRVEFSRPDSTDALRLARATELAERVLLRLPGIDWTAEPPPDPVEIVEVPETIAVEPVPRDRLALIRSSIDSGERSTFEGFRDALLDTLGEGDGTTDVAEGEVLDPTPTALVAAASAWVETAAEDEGSDAALVQSLIDRLVPTAALTLDPPGSPAGGSDAAATPSRRAQAGLPVQDAPASGCVQWFGLACQQAYGPTDAGPQLDPTRWFVVGPRQEELPVGSVTDDLLNDIREALTNAGILMDPLGAMPRVTVALAPTESPAFPVVGETLNTDDQCTIIVHTETAQGWVRPQLRQWIAYEIARCYAQANLAGTYVPDIGGTAFDDDWANPAAPYWLSAVAEPGGRLEEQFLPVFNTLDVATPVNERGAQSVFLFLLLHSLSGPDAVRDLINAAPVADPPALGSFLAADPDFGVLLQTLALSVTDAQLPDGAGSSYPNVAAFQTFELTEGEAYTFLAEPLRSGRMQLVVPAGSEACVQFERSSDILTNWREDDVASVGNWVPEPPEILRGTSWLVATTRVFEQAWTVTVDRVVDIGEGCDPDDGEDGIGPDPIEPTSCPVECEPTGFFDRRLLDDIFGG